MKFFRIGNFFLFVLAGLEQLILTVSSRNSFFIQNIEKNLACCLRNKRSIEFRLLIESFLFYDTEQMLIG